MMAFADPRSRQFGEPTSDYWQAMDIAGNTVTKKSRRQTSGDLSAFIIVPQSFDSSQKLEAF
jgi:hypothetical protein